MRYARQDGHCATCRGSARTALHAFDVEQAKPLPGAAFREQAVEHATVFGIDDRYSTSRQT
ncbi:hypothetical protein [Streptomyces mirabilis]|uniref:hypothetical protein n=1 Tax=Streptomyces mirabilis TaxID=68239 RepID=UPI0035E0B3DA